MTKKLAAAVLAMALVSAVPCLSYAGGIGVFCWTLAPYDNILCFDVDVKGFAMKLTGTDKMPDTSIDGAYGAVVFDNTAGVIVMDWTSGGINYTGRIDPITLTDGYWLDSNGYEGGLFFLGSGPQSLKSLVNHCIFHSPQLFRRSRAG